MEINSYLTISVRFNDDYIATVKKNTKDNQDEYGIHLHDSAFKEKSIDDVLAIMEMIEGAFIALSKAKIET